MKLQNSSKNFIRKKSQKFLQPITVTVEEREVELNATLLLHTSLCTVTGYLVIDIEVTHIVEVEQLSLTRPCSLHCSQKFTEDPLHEQKLYMITDCSRVMSK